MTNRKRTVIYIIAGFFAGVIIDLSGMYTEFFLSLDVKAVEQFVPVQFIEFFSTLITGILASIAGRFIAEQHNTIVDEKNKISSLNADFQNMLSHQPHGQIIISADLVPLYYNKPAELFCSLGLRLGIPFIELQMWLKDGNVFSCSIDNELYYFRTFISHLLWKGSSAVLVSFDDITTDKKLENIRNDVDRFMVHDIRSPLSGISGIAGLMLKKEYNHTDFVEYAQMIKEASEKVMGLLDERSVIFKLESGQKDFAIQPVNLSLIAAKIVKRLNIYANSRKVSVTASISQGITPDACICNANPLLISMLTENLLKNAIEASSAGDTVKVEISAQDDNLILDVSNPGTIPLEIRDTFFMKYVTHGKKNGTGVGTYICKIITEACNGSIFFTCLDSPPTVKISAVIPRANSL